MANLGAIGYSPRTRLLSSYPIVFSGTGKITGVVKQNGVNVVGKVALIDEKLTLCIDEAVGSAFAFKGLAINRTFTIVAQNTESTSFNALVYDRVSPVAL